MRVAAGVVAILVFPIAVVALDPDPLTPLYSAATLLLVAVGLTLMVAAFVLRSKRGPDQPLDEARVDRYNNVLALFLAVAVAVGSLIFSTREFSLVPFACGIAIVWALVWLPSITRRIAVQTQVQINRDAKSVFNFMLDGRNQMRYVPDLVSVEKITDGDIGPGTRFLSKVRMDGRGMFDGVEEIVEVDWGTRIVDRVANGTRPNRGVMTFQAVVGATLVTFRFESEVSYAAALYGQGLLRWALTGEMRRRRLETWGRLKRYLESQLDA